MNNIFKILGFSSLLSFFTLSAGARPMNPVVTSRDEIKIIGISVRTKNADEMTDKGKISPTWQKFYRVADKIPNKVHPETVLALYTDYESDFNGEYTFFIGQEVRTFDDVPEGFVAKVIPASKYAVFTSEQGAMPGIVFGVWKRIWSLNPGEVGSNRAYGTDFEVYNEKSKDPENAQIDVYLSIH